MAMISANCKMYANGYDISGIANVINFDMKNNVLDATSISDSLRKYVSGLNDTEISIEGFYDVNSDTAFWDSVGNGEIVFTFFECGATDGSMGYGIEPLTATYVPGFRVGELKSYSITFRARDKLVRLITDGELTLSTTQNGTGKNLGDVDADQYLYSFIQVLSLGGASPQITVTLESDSDNTFSSPTTRITHTTMSAVGAEAKKVAGEITDTWYRYVYTISGTSPSIKVIAGMGIL